MKPVILSFAVAAALFLPPDARATRVPGAQDALARDLEQCARPDWPADPLARQAGGKTTIELQVGADGRVAAARIKESSGRDDLDQAALASIHQCFFGAVHARGKATAGWREAQFVWVPLGATGPAVVDEALLAETRKRAAADDAAAQNRLGTWYQKGIYVEKDLVRAVAWYRVAAQAGNAYAQNNLGVLYNQGSGVRRDRRQAVSWYAKAAQQGHGWAQANLAWAYEHGSVGEKDIDLALYWLTRSAQGGLANAQMRLGYLAMGRAASDAERAAAAQWLERAAGQNDPTGLYYLGRSFELGKGKPQDDGAAAARYRLALGRTGGRAETALGLLIEAGRAPAREHDEALRLYQAAMAQRHADAYFRYGNLLEQRGDRALAAGIFRQGADMGSCEAAVRYVALRGPLGLPSERVGHDIYLRQASWCATRQAPPAPL